jgi:hypothetical protein
VVKVIQVKDAPTIGPHDVPDVGTFPMLVSDTDLSEAEWRARIKKDGLPLEIVERSASRMPAADEGTPVEAVVKEGGES